jgi:hypothetical protein
MKDTSGATVEATDPNPSCVTGSRFNTVWYKFTAPSNGTINADTHGSNYDTILVAGTAPTGAASFAEVACNDDTSGTDLTSQISFAAASGTQYFFMVGGFGPPSTSFGLAVFHLTFTPSSDFTISSPTGPQTVAAGASATFTITVATQGGNLANNVTFSVTGLPGASTGTFNPPSLGTSGGTSTLTISTTVRSAVPPMQKPRPPRPNPLLWLLAAVLAMMSYLLLRRGFRTRRLAVYLPLALLVLAAAFIAGCGGGGGGGGGQTGTPAGTYPLTVTATSGGVSHSATVTLIVN